MLALRDRVVVVTGAASGIGRGLAEAFAERGARLVLADLDASDLEATRRGLATAEASCSVVTDVTDPDAVERLAARAFDLRGEVAVLCNNAGVAAGGVVWEQSLEDWHWMFDANVLGIVHSLRSFVPRMLTQGTPAHIVNTASMMGLLTSPGLGAYSASKHAVVAISESLRHDLEASSASIRVSILCPGPVDTHIHEERTRPLDSRRISEADPERLAQRQQLAALMANSLSPRAVADCVVRAVLAEHFFVFSHPEHVAGIEPRYEEIRSSIA